MTKEMKSQQSDALEIAKIMKKNSHFLLQIFTEYKMKMILFFVYTIKVKIGRRE